MSLLPHGGRTRTPDGKVYEIGWAKSDTYFESFDGISKGRSRKLRSAGKEMVEDVMFIVKLH
jgi:hypothetical protein